jgi:hypothetical protein
LNFTSELYECMWPPHVRNTLIRPANPKSSVTYSFTETPKCSYPVNVTNFHSHDHKRDRKVVLL